MDDIKMTEKRYEWAANRYDGESIESKYKIDYVTEQNPTQISKGLVNNFRKIDNRAQSKSLRKLAYVDISK